MCHSQVTLWVFTGFQLDKFMQEDYQEALDVLLLAEEAFEMWNPKHLDMVDHD